MQADAASRSCNQQDGAGFMQNTLVPLLDSRGSLRNNLVTFRPLFGNSARVGASNSAYVEKQMKRVWLEKSCEKLETNSGYERQT